MRNIKWLFRFRDMYQLPPVLAAQVAHAKEI